MRFTHCSSLRLCIFSLFVLSPFLRFLPIPVSICLSALTCLCLTGLPCVSLRFLSLPQFSFSSPIHLCLSVYLCIPRTVLSCVSLRTFSLLFCFFSSSIYLCLSSYTRLSLTVLPPSPSLSIYIYHERVSRMEITWSMLVNNSSFC